MGKLLLSSSWLKISLPLLSFCVTVSISSTDGSTTTIVQPGPLVDFIIANQNVRDPFQVDWVKVIDADPRFCF